VGHRAKGGGGKSCACLLDRFPDALLDLLPLARCGGPHASGLLLCALQLRRQDLRPKKAIALSI
jgi:hypothetical protein